MGLRVYGLGLRVCVKGWGFNVKGPDSTIPSSSPYSYLPKGAVVFLGLWGLHNTLRQRCGTRNVTAFTVRRPQVVRGLKGFGFRVSLRFSPGEQPEREIARRTHPRRFRNFQISVSLWKSNV